VRGSLLQTARELPTIRCQGVWRLAEYRWYQRQFLSFCYLFQSLASHPRAHTPDCSACRYFSSQLKTLALLRYLHFQHGKIVSELWCTLLGWYFSMMFLFLPFLEAETYQKGDSPVGKLLRSTLCYRDSHRLGVPVVGCCEIRTATHTCWPGCHTTSDWGLSVTRSLSVMTQFKHNHDTQPQNLYDPIVTLWTWIPCLSDDMGPDVQQTKGKNMCMVWDALNNMCEGLQ